MSNQSHKPAQNLGRIASALLLLTAAMSTSAMSTERLDTHAPAQVQRQPAQVQEQAQPAQIERIYACVDDHGHRSFTDNGCSESRTRLPYHLDAQPSVDFSPLSQAERLALEEIATTSAQAQRKRQRQRETRAREASTRIASEQARCDEARAELKRLAHERRQGYSSKEHAALERREAIYKRARRVHC